MPKVISRVAGRGMRAHEIAEDVLQPGIRTVAAAIVALTDAQFAGAACIRL